MSPRYSSTTSRLGSMWGNGTHQFLPRKRDIVLYPSPTIVSTDTTVLLTTQSVRGDVGLCLLIAILLDIRIILDLWSFCSRAQFPCRKMCWHIQAHLFYACDLWKAAVDGGDRERVASISSTPLMMGLNRTLLVWKSVVRLESQMAWLRVDDELCSHRWRRKLITLFFTV